MGTLLPITSYQALYSLLGTAYGGDGTTTFGLPDLRGRMIVQPSDLKDRGAKLGAEAVALSAREMPPHTHQWYGYNGNADTSDPEGAVLAGAVSDLYSEPRFDPVPLAPQSMSDTGVGVAHDNMQPTLALNYIIALGGVYPVHS